MELDEHQSEMVLEHEEEKSEIQGCLDLADDYKEHLQLSIEKYLKTIEKLRKENKNLRVS